MATPTHALPESGAPHRSPLVHAAPKWQKSRKMKRFAELGMRPSEGGPQGGSGQMGGPLC
eukprot:889431-Karenia_brevis.AAC.1